MPSEAELYPPVRDFLKAQGFEVHAEAHRCDVVAKKGEELVIVELKRSFTLELLSQGVERQKLSDLVYLAIPQPSGPAIARLKNWLPMLRKLELGLLTVDEGTAQVMVLLQPNPFQRRREPKRRRALLSELSGRSGEENVGGTRGRKLVTAYRENAVLIAVALRRFGAMRPKDLRKLGTGPKTLSVLSGNVYGWFERQGRGVYGLSRKGAQELELWKSVCERKELLLPREPQVLGS